MYVCMCVCVRVCGEIEKARRRKRRRVVQKKESMIKKKESACVFLFEYKY